MTLRIRRSDGSIETYKNDDVARMSFELLARQGGTCTLSTKGGIPIATARGGLVEYRDHVLAGTVAAPPVVGADSSEPRRPSYAYLVAGIILGLVILTGALAGSGVPG